MFFDVLNLIYDSLDRIIEAVDIPTLFTVGTVPISLWEIMLGFLTVGIVFSFFLKSRSGSVLGSAKNFNQYEKNKNGGQ